MPGLLVQAIVDAPATPFSPDPSPLQAQRASPNSSFSSSSLRMAPASLKPPALTATTPAGKVSTTVILPSLGNAPVFTILIWRFPVPPGCRRVGYTVGKTAHPVPSVAATAGGTMTASVHTVAAPAPTFRALWNERFIT